MRGTLAAGLLTTTVALTACSGAAGPPAETRRVVPAEAASRVTDAQPSIWQTVLGHLDDRRALAYRRDDRRLLHRVYVAGSTVLRHDRRMLRAYDDAGVTLRGVRLQLLDVQLLQRTRRQVRLRVVDQLSRPTAHTEAGATLLPQDLPTRRIVLLRRVDDAWLVAAVRRLAG